MCSYMREGMNVPVQFLASDPEISIAGSARERFNEDLVFAIFIIFGMPGIVLVAHFWKPQP